uniref:Uncharacterized protein n=1 Tax=Plectus sambesii TaxID=2011161 RepID=A0A914WT34_9BILA
MNGTALEVALIRQAIAASVRRLIAPSPTSSALPGTTYKSIIANVIRRRRPLSTSTPQAAVPPCSSLRLPLAPPPPIHLHVALLESAAPVPLLLHCAVALRRAHDVLTTETIFPIQSALQ